MQKSKKIAIALFAFFFCATTFFWLVTKTINQKNVQQYIATELTNKTGLVTNISGPVTWHLFPKPALVIGSIAMGASHSPAIKIDNLRLNLKLAALLKGEILFNQIDVNGYSLNLPFPHADNTPTTAKSTKLQTTSLKTNIKIEHLLLSHGSINYKNDKKTITLADLQLGIDDLNFDMFNFPVQLKGKLEINHDGISLGSDTIQFKGTTALTNDFIKDPLSHSSNLLIDGQLLLQGVSSSPFKLNRLHALVKLKNNTLHLNPLTINLYDGESVGDLKYNVDTSYLIVNQTARSINSGKLGKDLFGHRLTKGKLDISLHCEAHGSDASNLLNSLKGYGNFSIKDGSILNFDLSKVVTNTTDKISQTLHQENALNKLLNFDQFKDPSFFTGRTAFKLFSAAIEFNHDQMIAKSYVLQTDIMQIKGSGTLNIEKNEIFSRLSATLFSEDAKLLTIQNLLGGHFPLVIQGNLSQPLVTPDLQLINPLLNKFWLAKTITKPMQQLKDQLQSLFN